MTLRLEGRIEVVDSDQAVLLLDEIACRCNAGQPAPACEEGFVFVFHLLVGVRPSPSQILECYI